MTDKYSSFRTKKRRIADDTELAYGTALDWSSEIVDSSEVDASSQSVSPAPASVVDNGLVHQYTFNEGNANDLVGTANGTINGPTHVSSGGPQSDGAYDFDGSNDYIGINGVADSLAGKSELTVSLWAKPVDGDRGTLFAINTDSGGNVFMLWLGSNGQNIKVYDGGGGGNSVESSVNDGTWRHIVLRMDSNGYDVFIDASEEIIDHASPNPPSASDHVSIGQEFDGGLSTSDHYNGLVDSVRVYDRALDSTEVETIWESEKP